MGAPTRAEVEAFSLRRKTLDFAPAIAWPLTSSKCPDDPSRIENAADLPSPNPFQRGLPGYEPEAQSVFQHGEAA